MQSHLQTIFQIVIVCLDLLDHPCTESLVRCALKIITVQVGTLNCPVVNTHILMHRARKLVTVYVKQNIMAPTAIVCHALQITFVMDQPRVWLMNVHTIHTHQKDQRHLTLSVCVLLVTHWKKLTVPLGVTFVQKDTFVLDKNRLAKYQLYSVWTDNTHRSLVPRKYSNVSA